jgi:hypothetical protein
MLTVPSALFDVVGEWYDQPTNVATRRLCDAIPGIVFTDKSDKHFVRTSLIIISCLVMRKDAPNTGDLKFGVDTVRQRLFRCGGRSRRCQGLEMRSE